MKQQFMEKEVLYSKKIALLKQKIEETNIELNESTANLSIAFETTPRQNEANYDHLDL